MVVEAPRTPESGGVPNGAPSPPISLSPSSMGTFTSCPLAFRFSYLERLPEPPTTPATKGTLVHLALQHLMWRAPSERTLANALADLARAADELAAHPEFAQLELTAEEQAQFSADAEVLVRRYFELEDPTRVHVLGVELRVTAETPEGVTIRGIIDRLELVDGELVVTDYKTGSAPSEGWEQRSLAGVHVYSLLCERMFGRRPARVQLLYLSGPEKIVTRSTDQSVRGVEIKSNAVMRAVRVACARDNFKPRPSALCAFCAFREFCPSFGGRPSEAAPTMKARQAGREGRPPLPLTFV
ncbi:MAG: RecB family exonuclease [Actinomycetota bacterium]